MSSSALEMARPRRAMRYTSSWNSVGVSSSGLPDRQAARAASSSTRSPASVVTECSRPARRSSAWTLASSSVRANGLQGNEPTGNLDRRASDGLLQFLRGAVTGFGQTVVMVTHDPVAAAYADRVVFLADGALAGELTRPTRDRILDAMKELESVRERGA